MADAGGRGRRRAALLPGARLPTELLAQLAWERPDAGDSPAADQNAGDGDAAAGGDPDLADALRISSADGGPDDGMAGEGGPSPAGHSPAAAQPPAAAAQQQAAAAPAYTSLARQQLHARLKAAIAAGTGSPAAPAASTARSVSGRQMPAQQRQRQVQGGPAAAGSSSSSDVPWSSPLLSGMASELLLPPLGAQPSLAVLAAVQPPAQPLLPVPAADLDESSGFQLPLPGASSWSQQGAASPPPAGPGPGSQPAAPHWLAAELLGQQLYHTLPAGSPPDAACLQPRQQQQGVQRGLLALAMPPLTERFFGALRGRAPSPRCVLAVLFEAACCCAAANRCLPARWFCPADLMPVRTRDAGGRPCLLVLPADGPSGRQEAAAAEAALQELLADPAGAAHRAATWRQQLLVGSSSAALLGLTAHYTPTQHQQQLRQPSEARAGHALLAGPSWLVSGGTRSSSRSTGGPPDLVSAVRSSSAFLRSESSCSMARSASPLSPLPRPASRLAAGDSRAQPRSSSACSTGCSGGLRQLPTLLPTAAVPPLPPPPPAPAAADPAWDAYCQASLAAGLAACAAEAVRQVEVGCAERGRLLARLWNAYTGTLAATLRQQAAQVAQLSTANANLSAGARCGWPSGAGSAWRLACCLLTCMQHNHTDHTRPLACLPARPAEVSQLRWEASSLDFLRREIGRLRKVCPLGQSLLEPGGAAWRQAGARHPALLLQAVLIKALRLPPTRLSTRRIRRPPHSPWRTAAGRWRACGRRWLRPTSSRRRWARTCAAGWQRCAGVPRQQRCSRLRPGARSLCPGAH